MMKKKFIACPAVPIRVVIRTVESAQRAFDMAVCEHFNTISMALNLPKRRA